MIHIAAFHAVARPLAVAALAIAGIAGPGLVAAHAGAPMPVASQPVVSCSTTARGPMSMPCAASPRGTAHGSVMGMPAGGRH